MIATTTRPGWVECIDLANPPRDTWTRIGQFGGGSAVCQLTSDGVYRMGVDDEGGVTEWKDKVEREVAFLRFRDLKATSFSSLPQWAWLALDRGILCDGEPHHYTAGNGHTRWISCDGRTLTLYSKVWRERVVKATFVLEAGA